MPGKSSLLRYLLVALTGLGTTDAAAADAVTDRLAGWLPVLIELRGYADPDWRHNTRWADGTVLDYVDYLHTQRTSGCPTMSWTPTCATTGGRW